MAKRVTLKDVASAAGVSPATVSNVLNSRWDRVSESTASLVLDAARKLKYQVATAGTKEKHVPGQTGVIGFLMGSSGEVFIDALLGAEAVATRFGYHLMLRSVNGEESRQLAAVQAMIERRVDGIIFLSPSRFTELDSVKAAVEAHIPFVVINRLTDADLGLHILIDNVSSAYQVTSHLIEMGHTRIANIHLPVNREPVARSAVDRLYGFRKAMEEYGLPVVEEWVRPGQSVPRLGSGAVGYSVAREMFSQQNHPTAVFCGTDYIAIGVLRAAADKGLNVPNDVAVVGHDDTLLAPHATPPLTSVRQPLEAAGARAAEALIQHLWKDVPLVGVERLGCQVIVRGSSTPYLHLDASGLGANHG